MPKLVSQKQNNLSEVQKKFLPPAFQQAIHTLYQFRNHYVSLIILESLPSLDATKYTAVAIIEPPKNPIGPTGCKGDKEDGQSTEYNEEL